MRALRHVAGFPDPGLLRPAPTAARPPTPLPGFAGYRSGIASRHPAAAGPRRLSRVPRTTIHAFNAQYAGGFLNARSWTKSAFHGLRRWRTGSAPSLPHLAAGSSDDAYSGFTCVADRAVDPAPLRTRPLDHARGLHYQGPRRLPGPDSHRQAALNLSLLRHVVLLFLMAPEQSRRTRQSRDWRAVGAPDRRDPTVSHKPVRDTRVRYADDQAPSARLGAFDSPASCFPHMPPRIRWTLTPPLTTAISSPAPRPGTRDDAPGAFSGLVTRALPTHHLLEHRQ